MNRTFTRRALAWLAVGAVATLASSVAAAVEPVFTDEEGVAIRGADPVAYFTEGAFHQGSPSLPFEWMQATWLFSSAENRARFVADPVKYAPKYGGYCAYAVSQGYTASIDPKAFTVVQGKLYLNYSKKVEQTWRADRDAFVKMADANWPRLLRPGGS